MVISGPHLAILQLWEFMAPLAMLNTQENYHVTKKLNMRSYYGAGKTEGQIKGMDFSPVHSPPLEPSFPVPLGAFSDVNHAILLGRKERLAKRQRRRKNLLGEFFNR